MSVPNYPGVPLLAQYAATPLGQFLLTADGPGVYNLAVPAQWGIFLNGAPVVTSDTVASFSFKTEWAISDYPIERGAFASYDKVEIPFDARFRFTSGGSEANRKALLDSIKAIAGDTTNLYDVITPEETDNSVTISHYDYQRTAVNGVGMISVDVWCLHVIPAGSPFGNTQSPSSAPQVSDGTVQALPASPGGGGAPTPSLSNFSPDVPHAGI